MSTLEKAIVNTADGRDDLKPPTDYALADDWVTAVCGEIFEVFRTVEGGVLILVSNEARAKIICQGLIDFIPQDLIVLQNKDDGVSGAVDGFIDLAADGLDGAVIGFGDAWEKMYLPGGLWQPVVNMIIVDLPILGESGEAIPDNKSLARFKQAIDRMSCSSVSGECLVHILDNRLYSGEKFAAFKAVIDAYPSQEWHSLDL